MPPDEPGYTEYLQGSLDAAQPPNVKGRIIVKFCRQGRYGNEHLCGWITTHGKCRVGFIQEQPGNGTVPVQLWNAPLSPKNCTADAAFKWLRS